MASKPVIVIVPGAWHRPTHYTRLALYLNASGYTVDCIDLFTADYDDQPEEPFKTYVTAIHEAILSHIQADRDVVVIMHSWGGVPGTEAAAGLAKPTGHDDKAGVVKLIYMASEIPQTEKSIRDAYPDIFPDIVEVDEKKPNFLVPIDAENMLYTDVPEALKKQALENLAPMPASVILHGPSKFAWREIPTAYMICEKDKAIPVAGADIMIAEVRKQGVEIETVRLDTGHSPFLSMPAQTARVIRGLLE